MSDHERVRELEQAISDKQSMLSMLRGFVEHPGWKHFGTVVEAQKTARLGFMHKPLKNMDETLEQEFMKGEISGLGLSRVLIHAEIEQLEHEAKVDEAKLEYEHELDAESAARKSGSASRVDGDTFA